ncbi:LysR family transcriptional regulator [uncultured Parasutterella sp.]|jgi:Transcriptional regulator|uniref:LysR family transcriptional regulator n=1 Tax=uncultured Parasutterella sp. TaxID=1263098 RepID=UPI0025989338|nr:LysR family transcriptional regulator [uncultured Parasutterella sp.]
MGAKNMTQSVSTSELFLSRQALIFLKAAETRNLSVTGQFFGLTQSAVSRAMIDWEKQWGCSLFDRTSRPISLTAEGKVLQQELNKQLEEFLNLAEEIKQKNRLKPILRIGCVESMSVDLLPQLIIRLKSKTKRLTTVIATSNSLYRQLREGQLDIIISSDPSAELSGLKQVLIFQEGSLIVLPKRFEGDPCCESWQGLQFCGIPFIKYHHATGGGKLNDVFFRSLGISLTNQLEVDSNSTMLSLIAEGVGWTISRVSTILQNKAYMDKIFFTKMPNPLLTRRLYVLTRQSEPELLMEQVIKEVCDILKTKIYPQLISIAPWMEKDIFVLDPKKSIFSSSEQER